jgi:hypothetical protein
LGNAIFRQMKSAFPQARAGGMPGADNLPLL